MPPHLDPDVGEVGAQSAHEGEQDPQRSGQPLDPSLQLGDAEMERRDELVQDRCCRDFRKRPSKPPGCRRTRDAEACGEGSVAGVPNEQQESMIVALLGSLGGYPGIVRVRGGRGVVRMSAPLPCAPNSDRNPGVPQRGARLHATNSAIDLLRH